jgi:hypothetical protein
MPQGWEEFLGHGMGTRAGRTPCSWLVETRVKSLETEHGGYAYKHNYLKGRDRRIVVRGWPRAKSVSHYLKNN